jgi:hypothetical protein
MQRSPEVRLAEHHHTVAEQVDRLLEEERHIVAVADEVGTALAVGPEVDIGFVVGPVQNLRVSRSSSRNITIS